MKKAEYYLNVNSEKRLELSGEYPKVTGWIEEIVGVDENGILTVGYDKRDTGHWVATEIKTGTSIFSCGGTRAKCSEYVHRNVDKILRQLEKVLCDDEWSREHIQPFRDYVNSVS